MFFAGDIITFTIILLVNNDLSKPYHNSSLLFVKIFSEKFHGMILMFDDFYAKCLFLMDSGAKRDRLPSYR